MQTANVFFAEAVVAEQTPEVRLNVDKVLSADVARSTREMYKRDFQAYTEWVNNSGLDWMNPTTFSKWRVALASGEILVKATKNRPAHPFSPRTINRMISAVKTIIKLAADIGELESDLVDSFKRVPAVRVKAMKERLKPHARTWLSEKELNQVIAAPDLNTLTGIRDRALLLTLASSGCRVSEVVTLTVTQIRKEKGYWAISVMGKNQDEPRLASLSPEAYNAIQTWLMERTKATGLWQPHIFTGIQGKSQRPLSEPMNPASAWKAVQRYAEAVGLPNVKPHDFRRSAGQIVYENTNDIFAVKEFLGHKNVGTTAAAYMKNQIKLGLTDGLFGVINEEE